MPSSGDAPPGRSRAAAQTLALRRLSDVDLEDVVEIHELSLPAYSPFRFFEKAFYPALLQPDSTGFGVVASGGLGVMGYCVGALDGSTFHRSLARHYRLESLRAKLTGGARPPVPGTFRSPPEIDPSQPWLLFTAVNPEDRGQGLGTALIRSAFKKLRAAGSDHCYGYIESENEDAQRLFERLGFQVVPDQVSAAGSSLLYRAEIGE